MGQKEDLTIKFACAKLIYLYYFRIYNFFPNLKLLSSLKIIIIAYSVKFNKIGYEKV